MLWTLPDESVHCVVTSPPYWGLRDYGVKGQIGLEKTPEEYVAKMVAVFREVRRVLRSDGTCWVNLGDSYAGGGGGNYSKGDKNNSGQNLTNVRNREEWLENAKLKPKDLCGIPWRLAFALQADGWWLRQDIIWAKSNPMPESVTDRCTKAHEYIFLLAKADRYFYDAEAIKEPASELTNCPPSPSNGPKTRMNMERSDEVSGHGWADAKVPYRPAFRNKRSVWTVPSYAFPEAHFATYPPDLIKPCILAGTSARGCCPKCGEPWERVVETTPMEIDRSERTHALGRTRSSGTMTKPSECKTLFWQPTCMCRTPGEYVDQLAGGEHYFKGEPLAPITCTVLDPFAGSFTTCAVALELGRSAIGIELNPSYVEMGRKRCAVTPGLAL